MPKLKHLLPSLREKKRYVAYKALAERPLDREFSSYVLHHVQRVLGLFDAAQAGVQNVEYNSKDQTGILRVGHRYVDKTRAALLLLGSYHDQKVLCRTTNISGILRKAMLFELGSKTSSLQRAKVN